MRSGDGAGRSASQLLRTSKWTKYPVLPTLERAMRVSVTEAKGQLTELVLRAEAGDEVILTRQGHAATTEERRGGKECGRTVRMPRSAQQLKNNTKTQQKINKLQSQII